MAPTHKSVRLPRVLPSRRRFANRVAAAGDAESAARKKWLRQQTSLASSLGKKQRWEDALALLHLPETTRWRPDIKMLTAVIGALERCSRWAQVLEILHQAELEGLPLDDRSLGLGISSVSKGRCWHEALRLMHLLRRMDTSSRHALGSHNALLSCLDWSGHWEEARDVLALMQRGLGLCGCFHRCAQTALPPTR